MQRELEFRNYSPRTVRSYLSAINVMSRFFNESPEKITHNQLKDYLQVRAQQDKASPSTINQIIGAFKILQVDILGNNWDNFRIKQAKRNKILPVVMAKEEISKLISVTKNLKHKSILSVTYSSGLRKSELRHLKVSDIDSKRIPFPGQGPESSDLGNNDRSGF